MDNSPRSYVITQISHHVLPPATYIVVVRDDCLTDDPPRHGCSAGNLMIDRADNANSASGELPAVAHDRMGVSAALRRFAMTTLLGIGLGLIVMLLVMRQVYHDTTPTLSPAQFHAAHEHFRSNKIANYDIEVQVTGPQASRYRVEVRDGEPVAAWRNGQPLQSQRTFGTWSIPGMFSTISRDIEAVERATAAGSQLPLILRAGFHPQFGYPERYRRIDNGSRKGGDSITVSWEVTAFRLIEHKPDA